jgi:acetyl esterase/lipase
MRHPMVGCGTSLVDHAASDDQRYPNRAKFAASGRQKGAPGDSPVFRIIIRLENAPAENSVLFYLALRKAGVPAEMHIYERGPHGVGLSPTDAVLATWPARLKDWLDIRGLLK